MSTHAQERGPSVAKVLLAGVAISYWVDFGFTRLTTQISWVRRIRKEKKVFPMQLYRGIGGRC